jgi:type IV secretion system protein TrbJ
MKQISRILGLVLAAIISTAAHAGAAENIVTGVASEVTQLLNNGELIKVAIDDATTASTVVSQYATQIEQFNIDKLNIAALLGLPPGLAADSVSILRNLTSYKQAITQLQGSLSQEQQLMSSRLAEARLGGTDLQTYLANVARDVATGNGKAVVRLQQEDAALQQVQSDYEFARNLQDQIPATIGQQQSLQMLNAHMNRVVTQNAKVIELMTASLNRDANTYQDEATGQAQNATIQNAIQQRQQTLLQRQRTFGGQ